jgi:hypothetical protein
MHRRQDSLALLLLLMTASFFGCASIKVERNIAFDGNDMNSRILHLKIVDNSTSSPDNFDGYINMLWTKDSRKAQAVKSTIDMLRSDLKAYGFQFVDVSEASRIIAQLEIASVRFDPVGGWITDGAVMVYRNRETGEQIGKVIARDTLVTPGLQESFRRITEGTLQLWGIKTPKE